MRKLFTYLLLLISLIGNTTNYFVSNSGSDAANGTSAGTAWQTIAKVNSFFASLQPGDIVSFNGGQTFVGTLTISRSGSSGNPITINSYGTGKAIISGFYTIPSWTSIGGGLYTATIPAALTTANMVTLNGAFQAMARWPKVGASNAGYLMYQSHVGTTSITSNAIGSALSYVGGEVVIRTSHWVLARGTVNAQTSNTVTYTTIGGNPQNATNNYGFFFQNHPNACTVLGDWAYNGTTKVLTMFFGGGGPGANAVQVSSVQSLITMGSGGRSYITFDNLQIRGANTNGIFFAGSSNNHIIINACDINFSGVDAITVTNSSHNTNSLTNCTTNYTNSNVITGQNSTSWTITGNTINNTGGVAGMGEGPTGPNSGGSYEALSYIGGSSLIELNTITNTGYLAINFRGSNLMIRKNFINVFGYAKDDVAGIYTWQNASSGTQILNNIVLNGIGVPQGTPDTRGQASGIYMDDNVSLVEIANNTVAYCAMTGHYNHNAHDFSVHDNTFFNNGGVGTVAASLGSQINYYNDGGTIDNLTVTNNIFFCKNIAQQVLVFGNGNQSSVAPWFTLTNNNYYCSPLNENTTFGGELTTGFVHTNLPGWRSLTGQEVNSRITPIPVTDTNKIRFEYNATNAAVVVSLAPNNYMDARGVVYLGTITLQAFTSAVLIQTTSGNSLPVVSAGPDQSITLPTNSVTMAGTTTDPDGSISSRVWTKLIGGAATITTPGSNTTTITGLVQGSYQFQLCATDNSGGTTCDVMNVTVIAAANQPPVSNAGTDKNITLPTNSVNQVGTASDPDGTVAGILWTKVSGPAGGTIVSNTSSTTVINALQVGTYIYNLRVTDNVGAFTNDQMSIVVNAANVPPIVSAGANQTITLPTSSVTLTATASDPDGSIVSYAWTKISGPAGGTITSPTAFQTTVTGYTNAGTYIYQVLVTDNGGLTASSTTQITVNPIVPPNTPPVVNAGADRNITLPTNTINQVGSATDPGGSVVSYAWTKISGPTVTIQTPTASTTNFNNLLQGTYIFQLAATDNLGAVGTDQFTLIVNAAPNTPPIVSAGVDQVITLPTATTTLTGTASDPGGSIASVLWTQIGGTASTIVSSGTLSTGITGLTTVGSRTYKLLATDNLGLTASDTIIVLVNAAPNQPPVSNAGTDKVITLPTASVTQVGTATDPDGTVAGILWTKVTGPASFNIVSNTSATTVINNLTQGTYTFNLRVTDNVGAFTNDQMSIVVNAALIAPTANAGANQSITLPTSFVTLTGIGTDPDGTITSYAWSKISGPASGTITSPSSATTTVTGYSLPGNYVYQLVVTDNSGLTGSSTTQVTVIAANIAPTANAGANQTITLPTSLVTLTGSGTDPDGTITTYAWTKISGPASGTITNPAAAITTVTAYSLPGTYIYRLTVVDNGGLTGSSTTQITVNSAPPPNLPPVVNAGTDKVLTLPTNSVSQVGSATDPDGTVSSYLWTKISGPATFTINTPAAATTTLSNLTQGTYIFQLQATDNQGATGTDQATVTVNSAPNIPPVANAGTDKNITLPTNSVSQVGSGTDADGTVTGYQWSQISGPATYTIVTPTASTTTINNLVQGTYVFQLQVTDNNSSTGTDQMTIIVNAAPNAPPVASAGIDQVKTLPTTTATLAGSATDDGSIASHVWSAVPGNPAVISFGDVNSYTSTVSGMVTAGSYTIKLLVTDNLGLTDTDTMIILVNPTPNVAPVANAGADIVDSTSTAVITITGSGTDADGTIVSYNWSKISGPAVFITSLSQAVTTITNFGVGVYVFRLRVTDNVGATATDDVTVTIVNVTPPSPQPTAPTADAGIDYKPIICVFCSSTSVTVTGIGTDGTSQIVSYVWTQVSGPTTATINSPNTASTVISNLKRGLYTFQFRVADGGGLSGTDTMTISVTKNYIVFRNGRFIVVNL